MKAVIFTLDGLTEVMLQDGTQYISEQDQDTTEFVESVKAAVLEDSSVELVTTEADVEKVNKRKTPTILKAVEATPEGVQRRILVGILNNRGLDENGNSLATPEKVTPKKPVVTEKEAKPKKEVAPKKSDEELATELEERKGSIRSTEIYLNAEKNIGFGITFTPHRDMTQVSGHIGNLAFSKDFKRVYYNVIEEVTNRKVCCAVLNNSIVLSESRVVETKVEKAEAKAKAKATKKAEKEAAKKEAIEKKAAEKAEKEVAKKAEKEVAKKAAADKKAAEKAAKEEASSTDKA